MHSGKTSTSTFVRFATLAGASAAFAAAAVIAVAAGAGPVPGYAFALAALGGILALLSQSITAVEHRERLEERIEAAPRDAYFRGYGDAAEDAFSGSQLH